MYNGIGVDESTLRKILAEHTEAKRREAEANARFVSSMSAKMVEWEAEFQKGAAACKPEVKKIEKGNPVRFAVKTA
jgi:hypothetical protein